MKIRQGFVSNSSTTSFTCDVCGRTETYYDSVDHTYFDFFLCENGHGVCEEHRLDHNLTAREKRQRLLDYLKGRDDDEFTRLYEIKDAAELDLFFECGNGEGLWCEYVAENGESEEFCPICQFVEVGNADFCKHLEKKTGITRDEIFAKVKAQNKRRRKLYDVEYVTLVCMQAGIDVSAELASLKAQYGTYKAFLESVK